MLEQTVKQLVQHRGSERRTRIPGTSFHSSLKPVTTCEISSSTDMTREARRCTTFDAGSWFASPTATAQGGER